MQPALKFLGILGRNSRFENSKNTPKNLPILSICFQLSLPYQRDQTFSRLLLNK